MENYLFYTFLSGALRLFYLFLNQYSVIPKLESLCKNVLTKGHNMRFQRKVQGPVVESIVSLTSSLRG